MLLYKTFTFDSAHYLPRVPAGHKCANLHGHTYTLKVFVEGKPDPLLGWVIDFNDLKKAICPIIDQLDHNLLNEIEGLNNPTSEMLAVWLWNKIITKLPGLKRIELNETPGSGVIYEGD